MKFKLKRGGEREGGDSLNRNKMSNAIPIYLTNSLFKHFNMLIHTINHSRRLRHIYEVILETLLNTKIKNPLTQQ